MGNPCAPDFLSYVENKFDIEYDRARFLVNNLVGPKILDVGCGSAPYGNTILANTNAKRIIGIDLDEACVEYAKKSYDTAMQFALGKVLPFPDKYFNSVFSVDVFGHIEFRHKDDVIGEIARVTAPEGRSVHIIECGQLDYFQMDPVNPDDPIRQYIYQEGHIGIEPADALLSRWRQHFQNVSIENAFIYPFAPLASFDAPYIPEDLRSIIKGFDEKQRKSAQIIMGFLSDTLKNGLRECDPQMLMPNENHPLRRHCGLVYVVATNPLS